MSRPFNEWPPTWVRFLGLTVLVCVLLTTLPAPPISAQTDEPESVPARLEGYLKSMEPGSWWVGDSHIIVNDQTVIIEKRGRAEVSAWLVVQGVKHLTGPIIAEFIIVERPAGQHGVLWPFAGTLTKQAGDLWVIGDTLVRVTTDTSISGAPQTGWLVWVIAEQPSDGLELQALAIEAIAADPSQVPVEFEGTLEALGPAWQVDGQVFRLSEQAVRIGELGVGQHVEVQATIQPDSTLIAHLIRAVNTSADAQLSALVAGIRSQPNGEQVWDLVVFRRSLG